MNCTLSARSLLAVLILTLGPAAGAQVPIAEAVERWQFDGKIKENEDLSGLAIRGRFLAVVADEKSTLQILEQDPNDGRRFSAHEKRNFKLEKDHRFREVDLEAVAWNEDALYVIGSHSRTRKRVRSDRSVARNLKRLATTTVEPGREWLYRVSVSDLGRVVAAESLSLRDVLANDPILRPFQTLPSKENGVDIEGLALDQAGRIYVGFRAPVLRGGYATVMVVTFDDEFDPGDIKYELRFLRLEGRGVRGLSRTADGFLVLSGPVGDGPGSYRVYSWNGQDSIPGEDVPKAHDNTVGQCDIPLPSNAKAEGIAFLGRIGNRNRFAVLFDSVENGEPTVFTCEVR